MISTNKLSNLQKVGFAFSGFKKEEKHMTSEPTKLMSKDPLANSNRRSTLLHPPPQLHNFHGIRGATRVLPMFVLFRAC